MPTFRFVLLVVWPVFTLTIVKQIIVKKSSPKNLSADCRSTVGQLLANCQPTVGWLSAICWLSVGKRPTDGRQVFPNT